MADEIAWRRNWRPDFDSQPWKVINTMDKTYSIKFYFEENSCSYKIAITDCENIWFEAIDQTLFTDRAKKLNPKVEAQNSYLLSHLLSSLNNPTTADKFSVKEDKEQNGQLLTLCLKSKLRAGIPFLWEFCCSLEQLQLMRKQFVLPILSMVGELQRRQAELVKLLQKKDHELQEYKDSGAVLSRKTLETPKFDEEAFKKKMTVSEGFLDVVDNCVDTVCTKECQELYKEIMIKNKWLYFKNTSVPNSDKGEALETVDDTLLLISNPEVSSWDTKLPPSLVDQIPSPPLKRSPAHSPKKSPIASPEKSPSKEVELKRRENLQKRLAEEKEKSKRKRKKLKL